MSSRGRGEGRGGEKRKKEWEGKEEGREREEEKKRKIHLEHFLSFSKKLGEIGAILYQTGCLKREMSLVIKS